jgi:hypothetical protein
MGLSDRRLTITRAEHNSAGWGINAGSALQSGVLLDEVRAEQMTELRAYRKAEKRAARRLRTNGERNGAVKQ